MPVMTSLAKWHRVGLHQVLDDRVQIELYVFERLDNLTFVTHHFWVSDLFPPP